MRKIDVAAVEALSEKERQDETQFTTKIGGKTSLGPSYLAFVKFSFPVTCLMSCYAQNWPFLPPNHKTLQITRIGNMAIHFEASKLNF